MSDTPEVQFSTCADLDRLWKEVPQLDASGRAFADFPLALWSENYDRKKFEQRATDAPHGAWHCSKCGHALALSFSDWGDPLWIYERVRFSNAKGDESQTEIWLARWNYPGQNPTGKAARRFSMFSFPALIRCPVPGCAIWNHVPRQPRKSGRLRHLEAMNADTTAVEEEISTASLCQDYGLERGAVGYWLRKWRDEKHLTNSETSQFTPEDKTKVRALFERYKARKSDIEHRKKQKS